MWPVARLVLVVGDVSEVIEPLAEDPAAFSLVLGGPLYQAWRRTHLVGHTLELLRRRVVVLTLLAWAPLLVLSIAEGHAWGGRVPLPFLRDVDVHVRLLVAVPLLIVAELVVHRRIAAVVRQFVDRGLIPDTARPTFDAAIASAMRLRNSVVAELVLLVVVYIWAWFVWRSRVGLDAPNWYEAPADGGLRLTWAGWWLECVSLPLWGFLLLRWYFRFLIWARFLWRVSRIELELMPMHPDRFGGLGFLAAVRYAFLPVLLAQGTVLAGLIAGRILNAGASLPQFKVELAGLVALMVLAILGPMLVFTPQLEAAHRRGLRQHGILAARYVREYDRKWLRGGAPADEPFVGSPDIQSLADLSNSFEVVNGMRWVPFTLTMMAQLAIVTLLPVAPLLLTMISMADLLDRLVKVVL